MNHIFDAYLVTTFDGRLLRLCEAEDDTISWPKTMATKALSK